ncbi:hypothetical protein QNO21_12020 [Microbacterium sp. zg-Y818]|uniref:hypothetical protein n=1 Tax=unclassified Microbacterium TaxID=2609290 RepID=UPI00214C8692|nr:MULTISPECIES: hypothetical protein [unclassified Microbacterium]MCR2799849.1 hypothetical protein [Microbacterium sp. zg.Y818]WIM21832.1 hypothetical protein QNO21_12020 [Microbacterium sp. zg-Y818]
MSTRHRLAAAVAVVAVALSLVACAPADGVRPVTTEESQVLASMRFRNFDAGTRALSFALEEGDLTLAIAGWYDFAGHRGYGLLDTGDGRALLAWSGDTVGMSAGAPEDGAAPLPMPEDAEWSTTPLDPTSSRLHALLAVIAGLGSDRPDNPLLLQQSGALWVAEETVDGEPVTVFAGPPSDEPLHTGAEVDPDASGTRYWVDAGGVLHRADIRVGGDWVRLDFAAAQNVDLGAGAAG